MIKRALYLGILVASGWKFLKTFQALRSVSRKREHKEALGVWEGEGGNPAGTHRTKRA